VIEIPERRAALVVVTEARRGKIRSFQVLGPFRFETVYSGVDSLQRTDLVLRQLFIYSNDEIDIAMSIEVTNGEGALQVGSDKRIAQGIPNAGDQFFED
jgi:hypothetical protein